jgi:hypothetical protein
MNAPSAGLSLKSCSCSLTYNLAWTCRMGERIQWCVTAQSCPSPDQLPPKYQQKLDKLNRVFHKYPVRHLGSATYSVEYVRETDGVATSHTVKLELDRETNVPRWRALCTCGRPWTRRQPCIHVYAACIQAKVQCSGGVKLRYTHNNAGCTETSPSVVALHQVEPWFYFDYRMTTRALCDLYSTWVGAAPVVAMGVVHSVHDVHRRIMSPLPPAFIGSPRPLGALKHSLAASQARQREAQANALPSHMGDGVSVGHEESEVRMAAYATLV